MTVTRTRRRESRRSPKQALQLTREDVLTAGEALQEAEWLRARRLEAWEVFEALPFPDRQDEAWRRTDLRGMPTVAFDHRVSKRQGEMPAGSGFAADVLLQAGSPAVIQRLPELTDRGVVVTSLLEAAQEHRALLERYLGTLVAPDDGKFAALAAAMAVDGLFVYVPEGVQLEQPIRSRLSVQEPGRAFATRTVVVLAPGASATVLQESVSPEQEELLTSGTVELFVEEGARLTYIQIQELGSQTWNVTHERASVGRDAVCDWFLAASGTKVTKSFMDLDLRGQGAEGRMSGFFLATGSQHLDLDTQQNHFAPHTISDLLFKGALKDASRSVWQGMIYVAPGAQKTDGYQANRNLLLSRSARADSIPGLEILADDVRCTHGATAGQLDEEPIFYLMSRGLPRLQAERLVVHGFFAEIFGRIQVEGYRHRFVNMIDGKL